LLAIIIFYFWQNKNKNAQKNDLGTNVGSTTEETSVESVSDEFPVSQGGGESSTPQVQISQVAPPSGEIIVPSTNASPQPAKTQATQGEKKQIIGDLDWTKNQSKQQSIAIDQNVLEKIGPNPDLCTLAGIQDSWSNPFEKTLCGIGKFFSQQITDSLSKMACEVMGAAFAGNYANSIKANYVGGQCLIIDR